MVPFLPSCLLLVPADLSSRVSYWLDNFWGRTIALTVNSSKALLVTLGSNRFLCGHRVWKAISYPWNGLGSICWHIWRSYLLIYLVPPPLKAQELPFLLPITQICPAAIHPDSCFSFSFWRWFPMVSRAQPLHLWTPRQPSLSEQSSHWSMWLWGLLGWRWSGGDLGSPGTPGTADLS